MTDKKIEPLTPEEIEEWRRIAYGPPGFHAAIASAATVQRLLATIDAERKARQKAEEQRDCAHRQTEWGVCTDCGFDYRTYDADDSKCDYCGSWRDHKLVCPRCSALTTDHEEGK
jgi:hypothetical protein